MKSSLLSVCIFVCLLFALGEDQSDPNVTHLTSAQRTLANASSLKVSESNSSVEHFEDDSTDEEEEEAEREHRFGAYSVLAITLVLVASSVLTYAFLEIKLHYIPESVCTIGVGMPPLPSLPYKMTPFVPYVVFRVGGGFAAPLR